jgi:hypothetical protein
MLAQRTLRTHTPPHMSPRPSDGKATAFRALVAAGCIGAVLFALVLSVIPRLHEQIHGASSAANHECAVTLLTSGNYQHTPTAAISVAPPVPPTAFAHFLASFQLVSAHLEFSLLEHAPPAVS